MMQSLIVLLAKEQYRLKKEGANHPAISQSVSLFFSPFHDPDCEVFDLKPDT